VLSPLLQLQDTLGSPVLQSQLELSAAAAATAAAADTACYRQLVLQQQQQQQQELLVTRTWLGNAASLASSTTSSTLPLPLQPSFPGSGSSSSSSFYPAARTSSNAHSSAFDTALRADVPSRVLLMPDETRSLSQQLPAAACPVTNIISNSVSNSISNMHAAECLPGLLVSSSSAGAGSSSFNSMSGAALYRGGGSSSGAVDWYNSPAAAATAAPVLKYGGGSVPSSGELYSAGHRLPLNEAHAVSNALQQRVAMLQQHARLQLAM
jgi:hypothetical protein